MQSIPTINTDLPSTPKSNLTPDRIVTLTTQTETSPSTMEPASPQLPSPNTPNSTISISPSPRHCHTRPLSPDLPTRDALYIFSNFSSYMRSPHEGAEGINSNADFRDTICLLDYARSLAAQPSSTVHVLHLKYRFQGTTAQFRSPYSTGDFRLPLNYRDSTGRLRNPVPQPFSALHDPVLKVDYHENGTFEPLPAQAIFSHIAKACQPPPRVIVMSYICSKVTENHLASLSNWALTSSPPAYVFSPLETRLRETRPLHLALHHAIPMSMYAAPKDAQVPLEQPTATVEPSPKHVVIRRRGSFPNLSEGGRGLSRSISPSGSKQYPPDPVASIIVGNAEEIETISTDSESPMPIAAPTLDRIPLWALAPGVGVLHGSTSASIGVQLGDFSAINLVSRPDPGPGIWQEGGHKAITPIGKSAGGVGMVSSPQAPPVPVATPHRQLTASRALPVTHGQGGQQGNVHLSPPDARSSVLARRPSLQNTSYQSWPSPVNRVAGWRKGRKEMMEDVVESGAIKTGMSPLSQATGSWAAGATRGREGQRRDAEPTAVVVQQGQVLGAARGDSGDNGLIELL